MSGHPYYFIILIALLLTSCNIEAPKVSSDKHTKTERRSKADSVLNLTLVAHGVENFNNNTIEFTFRNKRFSIEEQKGEFTYQSSYTKEKDSIKNLLKGNKITQWINQEKQSLTEDEKLKFTEALNSVIYFATLPLKLQDQAVITQWKGTTTIKGKNYIQLGITFQKEGGGTDYNDEFLYWINDSTHQIDYLAYNYQVNKGGVRFRSAFNKRNVNGVVFQDYVNFKATVGIPLTDLPALYESGELEQLSLIETENITHTTY